MTAPGTNGIPWLGMERPVKSHVVAAIHFAPKSNDGPCDCSCGESMLASEFSQHRRREGEVRSALKSGATPDVSVWDRKAICKGYNCDRPPKAKGFCIAHYERSKRGSSTDSPIRNYGPAGTRQVAP